MNVDCFRYVRYVLGLLVGLPLMVYANESTTQATQVSSGDSAWVLTATALVLMMTIPGLALFYAGMVRKKNILSTMMHSLSAVAVVSVVWLVVGYSLAFGENNGFIGSLDHLFLAGISPDDVTGSIPTLLVVVFQMTFAIITVAILAGSLAERMKFGAFVLFAALWVVLVYTPVCHWIWGGGWLFGDALDFAGGTVVHINAGVAGLVLAIMLGKRKGYGSANLAPANLSLNTVGVGLLWVGWFGFNGGSALGANGSAAMALITTQVAAAVGMMTWLVAEYIHHHKASVLGGGSGAIAGLVGITPAAGFVDVGGALGIGVLTALGCFYMITMLKAKLNIDDSLDAFGLHGVGGIIGAILTGVFVRADVLHELGVSYLHQLWLQIEGVLAVMVYCGIVSFVIALFIKHTIGLRVNEEDEHLGLDLALHGEKIGV